MTDETNAPESEAEAPAKPAPKRKAPAKKAPAKKPAAKAPAKKPATSEVGGNARPAPKKDSDPSADVIGGNAKAQLKALSRSILDLEAEKAEVAAEIKEKYAEAKSMGFDTKILRKVVAASKRDPNELEEERALFDLYANAADIYSKMES